jgi:protein-S-isoprenylcysteine O-methyltransferase Ste14
VNIDHNSEYYARNSRTPLCLDRFKQICRERESGHFEVICEESASLKIGFDIAGAPLYNPDMNGPTRISLLTLSGVLVCWFFFAGIFLLRNRPPKAPEAKRDKTASVGIFLQMCAYFLVFFQPPGRPFLPRVETLTGIVGIVFCILTIALAAGSGWLLESAVRTLGKQWAVQARLVEGHKLVTEGPYAYVRNPIYTGMLGMLIATGLAFEHWTALMIAIVIFMVGLVIRVRTEERLLRSAFGAEFEEYAKRVPAVLPGIY